MIHLLYTIKLLLNSPIKQLWVIGY